MKKTLSQRELLRAKRAEERRSGPAPAVLPYSRPRKRAECAAPEAVRPCPYVACRHHLYLDVWQDSGSIKLNHPDKEVWDLEDSCVLDLAEDRGGMTLDEVARLLNVTRERVRQLEERALKRFAEIVGNPEQLTVRAPAPQRRPRLRKHKPSLRTADVLAALGLNRGDTWMRRVLRKSMRDAGWPSPTSTTDLG